MVRPRTRDLALALVLFAATALFTWWQDQRLAVLWDVSYVLDSSVRFALGQPMYRTLPFVHPPLTFLVQAGILRLLGRAYWHHTLYAALAGGAGSVLALGLLRRVLRRGGQPWLRAALLAAPLVVLGIYSIFPTPFYDCDCILTVLLSLWLLARYDRLPAPTRVRALLTGAAVAVPLFVKQNIGLPYLLATGVCVAALAVAEQRQPRTLLPRRRWGYVLLGVGLALGVAALVLQATVGLGHYLYWTITFAASRRLPGASAMLSVYAFPALLWQVPAMLSGWAMLRWSVAGPAARRIWLRVGALLLLAAPLVYTLVLFFVQTEADDRADNLLALWPLLLVLAVVAAAMQLLRAVRRGRLNWLDVLPWLLLAIIHGTLMSQQLWGSTYAIWPLLLVLVAQLAVRMEDGSGAGAGRAVTAWVAVVSATLLVCGSAYAASAERLSYASLQDGPLQHSVQPALAGMAIRGPYLPEFDAMVAYTNAHIPQGDAILLIPGEDPFYFATGRVPRVPFLLFDPTTDPDTPQQLAAMVRADDVRWLIVKRRQQLVADPTPDATAVLQALQPMFRLDHAMPGYDIYRRVDAGAR